MTDIREKGSRGDGVRWIAFGLIALGGAVVDLWTKHRVFAWLGLPGERPPYWIVEPYIGLETTVNPGALFGMGAGWGLLFALLSVAASAGLLFWLGRLGAISSWWLTVALAAVQGGILGNLYDRLGFWNPPAERPDWSSGVRDWILLRYGDFTWPNLTSRTACSSAAPSCWPCIRSSMPHVRPNQWRKDPPTTENLRGRLAFAGRFFSRRARKKLVFKVAPSG